MIFRGTGGSLHPLVRGDCLVEAEPADPESIVPGDLVVFLGRGRVVCHQVIWRDRREGMPWFFLSGNHTERADGWTPAYRILGRVTAVDGRPVPESARRRLRLRSAWLHGVLHHVFARPWVRALERGRLRGLFLRVVHGG